jgi:hypothetical protein
MGLPDVCYVEDREQLSHGCLLFYLVKSAVLQPAPNLLHFKACFLIESQDYRLLPEIVISPIKDKKIPIKFTADGLNL